MNNKNQKNQSQPGAYSGRYLSQSRPKQGVNDVLQKVFTLHRVLEMLHTTQGRKRAEKAALENEQRIAQGLVSDRQENNRLGILNDLESDNYARSFSEGGLYLGMLDDKPLLRKDDWHVTCVAMAGAGKTTSICIPNILTLAMGDAPESCFIFDVKTELYPATRHAREKLDGVPPILIDDFDVIGGGVRINFLQDLIEKAQLGEPIVEDVLGKLALQYGDPSTRGTNAWIAIEAIEWNSAYMIYTAELEPDNCIPGAMADFATLTQDEMRVEFEKMLISTAGGGAVSDIAKNWLSSYAEPCDQFNWVRGEFRAAWSLYGKGCVLRDKRSKTEFDVRELKKHPRAVYYQFPDTKIRSHKKDAAAILDFLLGQLANAEGTIRTTILADEFSNFPRALSTVTALRLYRSRLIRMFVFSQDENGFQAYKEEGGFAPFKENSICIYFGVDGKIAKDLSEKAGNKSVLIPTNSANAGVTNTGGLSSNEVTTPVLPVSDIAHNFSGKAYVDMRDRIFLVDRPAYWDKGVNG